MIDARQRLKCLSVNTLQFRVENTHASVYNSKGVSQLRCDPQIQDLVDLWIQKPSSEPITRFCIYHLYYTVSFYQFYKPSSRAYVIDCERACASSCAYTCAYRTGKLNQALWLCPNQRSFFNIKQEAHWALQTGRATS